ncbi:MAG: cupin domain-containing protein [Acidobacteria bacterium]|nr:cupin domain-containing protein [Acidobacteriota bacterium]
MPFINTNRLETKEPRPGWKGRFINSETMTFGYYDIEAGASIHEHFHSNEEVWHILEGELEVTIDGQTQVAGPGAVAVIPPNTLHSVKALSVGRAIVVDQPRREAIGGIKTDCKEQKP